MKTLQQLARLSIAELERDMNKVAEKYGEAVRAQVVTDLIAHVHGKGGAR